MTHEFVDNGKGQCEAIVNDFTGPCGCKKDNPIHLTNSEVYSVENIELMYMSDDFKSRLDKRYSGR